MTLRQNRRMNDAIHIGEVASRTGLSLRTVRYYESVGLVEPSGRTEGGFRLYTEPDVQRLLLIRSLKPAEFSLEQLEQLLSLHDCLLDEESHGSDRALALARFRSLVEDAALRIRVQRERLIAAEMAIELLGAAAPAAPGAAHQSIATSAASGGEGAR